MPKVVYSASKGLYQESGSGFEIGDVSVAEASETLTTVKAPATYGTTVLDGTSVNLDGPALELADGSSVGAVKFFTCSNITSGDPKVLVDNGIMNDGSSPLASLEFTAVNQHALLIWNGSNWICVSKTATEA